MQKLEIIQFYVSAEESFYQINIIEVKPTRRTHNPTKIQFENINSIILFLAPICFMIVWVIVVLIVLTYFKVIRHKREKLNSKTLQQIPCKKCQYFSDNQYLKCALHPSCALTKEAINCSDYCPKQ